MTRARGRAFVLINEWQCVSVLIRLRMPVAVLVESILSTILILALCGCRHRPINMALDAFRKKTEATVNAMDLSFGPNGKDTFSWPQGFASLLVSRIKLVACTVQMSVAL